MIYSEIFHVFFIIAVFGIDLVKGESRRCSFEDVSGKDLGKMPIAYTFNTNKKAYIIYPDETGYFTIGSNQKIVISCSDSFFELAELSAFQDIEITCHNATQFFHNRKIYNFSQFKCKNILRSESRKSSKKCIPNNNTVIDVGFKTRGFFFPLYCVCYDEGNARTLYTWYIVRSPFSSHIQDYERTRFFKDDIHENINLNAAYNNHRATIISILGLNSNQNQTQIQFVNDQEHYLSRGHFIPRADSYYAREQAATCSFLNIFPHWNKCNATWTEIENVVKSEMKKYPNHKRVIVTGVYGKFTLPDAQNRNKELYLIFPQKLAVPKLIWKMVYDSNNRRNSVVYISYNNRKFDPQQEKVKPDINCKTKKCPGDITNRYTLEWIDKGSIYCCDIQSFQTKYIRFNKDVLSVTPNAVPAA